jgi:hypothetical protein
MKTNIQQLILCSLISLSTSLVSTPAAATPTQSINSEINLSLLHGLWHMIEQARQAVSKALPNEYHEVFENLVAKIDRFIKDPSLFPVLTQSTHYDWSTGIHYTTPNLAEQKQQCNQILQSYFAPIKNALTTYQYNNKDQSTVNACTKALTELDTLLTNSYYLYGFLVSVRAEVFFQQCVLSQTSITHANKDTLSVPLLFPLLLQQLDSLKTTLLSSCQRSPNLLIDSILTMLLGKTTDSLAAPLGSEQFAQIIRHVDKLESLYKKRPFQKADKPEQKTNLKAIKHFKKCIKDALKLLYAYIPLFIIQNEGSKDLIGVVLDKAAITHTATKNAGLAMLPGLMLLLAGIIVTGVGAYRPYGYRYNYHYHSALSRTESKMVEGGAWMILGGLFAAGIGAGVTYPITHAVLKARHNKKPRTKNIHHAK